MLLVWGFISMCFFVALPLFFAKIVQGERRATESAKRFSVAMLNRSPFYAKLLLFSVDAVAEAVFFGQIVHKSLVHVDAMCGALEAERLSATSGHEAEAHFSSGVGGGGGCEGVEKFGEIGLGGF